MDGCKNPPADDIRRGVLSSEPLGKTPGVQRAGEVRPLSRDRRLPASAPAEFSQVVLQVGYLPIGKGVLEGRHHPRYIGSRPAVLYHLYNLLIREFAHVRGARVVPWGLRAASAAFRAGCSPRFFLVMELQAIGLMGFGSFSQPARNSFLNLFPAYQSPGPFSSSALSMVAFFCGLFVSWHALQFPAVKISLPYGAPVWPGPYEKSVANAKTARAIRPLRSVSLKPDLLPFYLMNLRAPFSYSATSVESWPRTKLA